MWPRIGSTGIRIISDLIQALAFDEVDVVILNDPPPELASRVVLDGLRVFRGDPTGTRAGRSG